MFFVDVQNRGKGVLFKFGEKIIKQDVLMATVKVSDSPRFYKKALPEGCGRLLSEGSYDAGFLSSAVPATVHRNPSVWRIFTKILNQKKLQKQ